MKKQGELYLKVISIVIAGVIVAYVLFSVLLSRGSSYAIEPAVRCEVGDGQTVSGFVVRSEKLLGTDHNIVVCELSEGQRVGGGQSIATAYADEAAYTQRRELLELETQLAQLSYAAEGVEESSSATLDARIDELLLQTAALVARGQLEGASSLGAELQPCVLRRDVTDADQSRIDERMRTLRNAIASLSGASGGIQSITVSSSGYFSEVVDGYEEVLTPEFLEEISLTQLRQLSPRKSSTSQNTIGRLILGQRWYFVTEAPAQRLEGCSPGEQLTVNFSGATAQTAPMTIERIGEAEEGNCILVLSCDRGLQTMTSLRELTADIVFETYSGLYVPVQALYYLDGSPGVYVLEGIRAEWKEVEVLYAYDDGYVVTLDQSDTDNLWPEDSIILTSEDIYDGKVME